ncbi:MAG: DNA-processing protein DprA [Alphaproteobacteria bacterium]|nr:DNA-processing protein DprA [Alphaproteobacteria bacterium]
MNNMKSLFEHLLILRSPGVGPVTYEKLLGRFGSVEAVIESLNPSQDLRDSIMREIDTAAQMDIKFVFDTDEFYPAGLRRLKNHPPILTVRGNMETLRHESVAMVGTRHATAVGMEFVANMATAFAEHNICVVSGMAMGTDSAAHIGALRAKGETNTIAVLAGGVDYIWPLENESLYYEILERGAVVSEMPIGFVPKGTNFVQRNRLVAGIGEKLILSEADLKSGSMKTAEFAREYGRIVYAVPSHPADSRAAGPNSLIRSGQALLCQGVSDFFSNTKIKEKSLQKNESENEILNKIGTVPLSESVLAEIVGKSISEIKRELVILELQGLIEKQDNGYVRL